MTIAAVSGGKSLMSELPVWLVELSVEGPVTVRGAFRTIEQKGFQLDNPFYSDVEIRNAPYGLRATVTARASNEKLAFEAGVFFFGRMLDTLTLAIDRPMYVIIGEGDRGRGTRRDVRRVIEPREFEDAFQGANQLATHSPSFLRSLGWYRKGLQADDPFDKFLSFWNAIEIVASKYYRYVPSIDKERAKKGSKSQVWECFKVVWGPCERWPVIPGISTWIDESYDIRNGIAHGREAVDITKIADVATRLSTIQEVAHRFLTDWHRDLLDIDRGAPSESLESNDTEQPLL